MTEAEKHQAHLKLALRWYNNGLWSLKEAAKWANMRQVDFKALSTKKETNT